MQARAPRVVLVMLARDEADVIGGALRWHLATGVDHAIVMDHESKDATPDILSDLARDGRVTHIRRGGLYAQAEMTSELVRIAAADHGADWVVPCDADEFWTCGGASFKDVIAASPFNIIRFPTVNFVTTALDDAAIADPVLRMQHKVPKPPKIPKLPYVIKPSQSKVMFAVDGFRGIAMGNHDVKLDAPRPGRHDSALIHHYPLRSREHFFTKVIQGGAALEANKALAPNAGYHWRRWYAIYKQGGLEKEWQRLCLGKFRLAALRALNVVVKDEAFGPLYRRSIESSAAQAGPARVNRA
jgi:hypothetical protein